jgi:hypothetical protein
MGEVLTSVVVAAAVAAVVAGAVAVTAARVSQQRPPPLDEGAPPPRVVMMVPRAPPPPPVVRVAIDPNLTSAAPETYSQVGFLTREDSAPLPLYGQASLVRRYRHFYYTLLPGTGIKVSVFVGRRDCMEDVGCEELGDGDEVHVPETTGGPWTVKIYSRTMRM